MTGDRDLAGIKVSPVRRAEVLRAVEAALAARAPLRITFLNPDYARRALLDPGLRRDVGGFDLVLVDGNGVRLVAPLFGFTVPERLDTDSLGPEVFATCARVGASVYLFGCAPGVAERAATALQARHPGLRVVGTEHGYHDVLRGTPGQFPVDRSEAVIGDVEATGADVLVVSLPTPLQQRWVAENGRRVRAPVVITAGSYLDHVADGDGAWYPGWVVSLQLNWLYRLVREPRRLWRRYTVESLHFLALVLRARVRGTGG